MCRQLAMRTGQTSGSILSPPSDSASPRHMNSAHEQRFMATSSQVPLHQCSENQGLESVIWSERHFHLCFSMVADLSATNATLLGKTIHTCLTFQQRSFFQHIFILPPPTIFQIVINISLKEPLVLFVIRPGNYLFLLRLKYFSYPLKKSYYKSIHE